MSSARRLEKTVTEDHTQRRRTDQATRLALPSTPLAGLALAARTTRMPAGSRWTPVGTSTCLEDRTVWVHCTRAGTLCPTCRCCRGPRKLFGAPACGAGQRPAKWLEPGTIPARHAYRHKRCERERSDRDYPTKTHTPGSLSCLSGGRAGAPRSRPVNDVRAIQTTSQQVALGWLGGPSSTCVFHSQACRSFRGASERRVSRSPTECALYYSCTGGEPACYV